MDQDNKRYILKKLMQDALGEEERTALNERDAVKTQMLSQWNNAPVLRILTGLSSMRIWHRIRQSIWDNVSVKDIYSIKFIVWQHLFYCCWLSEGWLII